MADPEFRVGGKQPGNLYRVTDDHPEGKRFGFVLRDEDGPMVAAALNAFVDTGRERDELLAGKPRLCDDCSINYRAWSARP